MRLANLYRTYGLRGFLSLLLNFFLTKLFYPRARLIRFPFYIRGAKNIILGESFTAGVGVRLDAFNKNDKAVLIVGDRVQLNDYVHIGAIEHVSIGSDVLIASRVFISDHNHGDYEGHDVSSSPNTIPKDRPLKSKPVIICDKVWIGENVSILAGVRIGAGSIIGAGSVVTKDIPDASIAVGNPARVVKVFDFQKNVWRSL